MQNFKLQHLTFFYTTFTSEKTKCSLEKLHLKTKL